MRHRVRLVSLAVVVLLVLLVAFAPAVLAGPSVPSAGAAGNLSYQCPFLDTPALAEFEVWQKSGSFDGGGWCIVQAPEYGITSRVAVKLVNVEGDRVYFAGTVTGGASWWYFAAEQGEYPHGRAVGMFVNGRNAALALVEGESELSEWGGGFQRLEKGSWVLVW